MKKLPDAEFQVMKVVWNTDNPITANKIMEQLGEEKGWKVQTAITLLNRLVKRGFLRTEKKGKERFYYQIVKKEDYLQFETGNFMEQYYENSFFNFVHTLYNGKQVKEEEIEQLLEWVKKQEK